jgi:hypothetical protein
VAVAGAYDIVRAEVFIYRLSLGGRLDNEQIFGHKSTAFVRTLRYAPQILPQTYGFLFSVYGFRSLSVCGMGSKETKFTAFMQKTRRLLHKGNL